jgi:serine/threonine protein kinase
MMPCWCLCRCVFTGDEWASLDLAVKVVDKAAFWEHVTQQCGEEQGGAVWRQLRCEVHASWRLRCHPTCVRTVAVAETPADVYVVMERLRGRSLLDCVADCAWSERRCVEAVVHVLDALQFMHGLGIAHRDVKLENVLLTSDSDATAHVKLIDYGAAALQRCGSHPEGDPLCYVGSVQYMAPEVVARESEARISAEEQLHTMRSISGKPAGFDAPRLSSSSSSSSPPLPCPFAAGSKADVWATGVLLYALLAKRLPFNASVDCGAGGHTSDFQDEVVKLRIRWMQMEVPLARIVASRRVKTLLGAMLAPQPDLRPTAAQACVQAREALAAPLVTAA